ncbi:hypothetical protein ACH5RR_031568 [Cinchona calisaya]|uniref:Uncharacterized protein n=1 Tax=Cinchona calisaya TaxID=153742 RepID=A0ABD2YHJ9_9GENT
MMIFRHIYKYKPIRRNDSGEVEDFLSQATAVSKIKPVGSWGICKCPPSVLAHLGHQGKLLASHARFGPFYREGESEVSGKKEAWEKILEKSSPGDGDKDKTVETYLSVMRRVEKDARDAYGGYKSLYDLTESEFRWMMIQDGCFFLQLALLVLGVPSNKMGYSDNHIIFGKKENNKVAVKRWIESMFFVGNQIPLVVLNEFMKQDFFQNIIISHKKSGWDVPPPSDLCKKILYDLLVLPALEYYNTNHLKTSPQPKIYGTITYCDLLHALHSLIVGSGRGQIVQDETEGDEDLEAAGGQLNKEANKDSTFSASELEKKGIRFRKFELQVGNYPNKEIIIFKDYILFARLYLPTFVVDENTEMLWRSLEYYEMSQKQEGEGSSYAVRSYLQFMNDLICTYEDVKLLEKKGIIKPNNPYYKDKLPIILSKLVGKDKYNTQNLHLLRIRLRDYNLAPWERFKIVAILLFVLSFIQAFFAVLAYFRPTKQG